jgi:hypothetical protein
MIGHRMARDKQFPVGQAIRSSVGEPMFHTAIENHLQIPTSGLDVLREIRDIFESNKKSRVPWHTKTSGFHSTCHCGARLPQACRESSVHLSHFCTGPC